MKRISADEFAAHAAEYLRSDEALEVERDGRVIGRYAPSVVPNGHAVNGRQGSGLLAEESAGDGDVRGALDALEQVLEEIYARTGMTEDEFAAYFDLTRPFPYDKTPEA